jgi:hypothetical protein
LRGWATLRAQGGTRGSDFEAHAFGLPQIGNDLEQVARLGVATGTEHAHQAFRGAMRKVAQLGKAPCENQDRVSRAPGWFPLNLASKPWSSLHDFFVVFSS